MKKLAFMALAAILWPPAQPSNQQALNQGVDEPNRKRLLTAVENESALKCFTKSDSPEVLIDMNLVFTKYPTARIIPAG